MSAQSFPPFSTASIYARTGALYASIYPSYPMNRVRYSGTTFSENDIFDFKPDPEDPRVTKKELLVNVLKSKLN